MSTPFGPSQIFIHGPNAPRFTKSARGLDLVMWPGPKSVVIVKGRVPLFKSIHYPTHDGYGMKITGMKTLRYATFEFCGGMIDNIVDATSATDDLAEIGQAVQPLLDYMQGKFLIV